jgi:DNA-binding CsgD family transcriptional regulator
MGFVNVSARIQLVSDGHLCGAIGVVDGGQEMRLSPSWQGAALSLLSEFPQLLNVQETGKELAMRSVDEALPAIGKPAQAIVTDDERAKIAQLTEREREVVHLLSEGLRNQQIADRLHISVITVRHHLSSIFAKLGLDDRFQTAIFALRTGLARPFWMDEIAARNVNVAAGQ